MKNRKRSNYSFANINLLGKCNFDCYFCLGKDLPELKQYNNLNDHFHCWVNFNKFIDMCRLHHIEKVYITGQTADSLQYRYLRELINYLKICKFKVGLRSNGKLASKNFDIIKSCNDEIGYTINSLNPERHKIITGTSSIPHWDYILRNSGNNVRVSVVVNRYNYKEIWSMINYITNIETLKYLQIRRVSTDTRNKKLQTDIDLFENLALIIAKHYKKIGSYETAPIYNINTIPVILWRTTETTVNSINYFTDGTLSDNYFIIEGYQESKRLIE